VLNSSDILKTINIYFPKEISYDSLEYKSSNEFLSRIRKQEEVKLNNSYKTHLYLGIKNIFHKYEVGDWTDMEAFNCYEYRILLHQNQPILDDDTELMKALEGKKIELFLFVSVLSKYYYFFTNETMIDLTSGKWQFKKIFDYPEKIKGEIENLKVFFDVDGYNKISNDIANEVVDNIETELIEKNKVKVFNCLFTDLILI